MSAADTIINEINKEINALPTGPYGEVIFDDSFFADLPEPEYFLSPGPDVLEGHEGLDDDPILRDRRLLGVYIPMHSPGRVMLFRHRLRQFYWSLVQRLRHGLPYLSPLDLQGALDLVIRKTHEHELFHFHCDVLRQLFGGQYRRDPEEALAVAWSRLTILQQRGQWNARIGRMNGVLYTRLLDAAFAYRSPGYCDWPRFADDARFRPALLDHIAGTPAVARLQANGVSNLPNLLFDLLGRVSGGYVETVV